MGARLTVCVHVQLQGVHKAHRQGRGWQLVGCLQKKCRLPCAAWRMKLMLLLPLPWSRRMLQSWLSSRLNPLPRYIRFQGCSTANLT